MMLCLLVAAGWTQTLREASANTHTYSVERDMGLHLSRWREPPTHCQLLYNMYCITAESNRPPPWNNTLRHTSSRSLQALAPNHGDMRSPYMHTFAQRQFSSCLETPSPRRAVLDAPVGCYSVSKRPASQLDTLISSQDSWSGSQPVRRIINLSVSQSYSCAPSHTAVRLTRLSAIQTAARSVRQSRHIFSR